MAHACNVDAAFALLLSGLIVSCGGRAVREGAGNRSQSGDAATDARELPLPEHRVIQLAVGQPSLALFADGSVWGWREDWKDGKVFFGSAVHYASLDGAVALTQ